MSQKTKMSKVRESPHTDIYSSKPAVAALELVDGAYEIVELSKAETPAQKKWKANWLAKARSLGAQPFAILIILSAFLLTGCYQDLQADLTMKAEDLLDSPSITCEYSNGYANYVLSNGTLRIKNDGSVDLVIQHVSGTSFVTLSGANGVRGQKVTSRFGVASMSHEDFMASEAARSAVLMNVIKEVSNLVANAIRVEVVDEETKGSQQ